MARQTIEISVPRPRDEHHIRRDGKRTHQSVFSMRLPGAQFDRVVDLIHDETRDLHDLSVQLAERKVELRRELLHPDTTMKQRSALQQDFETTTFHLAAVKSEVMRRDEGQGRGDQRWTRAFVVEAMKRLPPDVVAQIEEAATLAAGVSCTAGRVRL